MTVLRSGMFVYSSNISNVVLSYLFWVVVAWLAGSEGPGFIGYLSSIVAFCTIISTGTLLGMPMSVQRYIGKAVAAKDPSQVSAYASGALVVVILVTGAALLSILTLNDSIRSLTGFSPDLLGISLLLILEMVLYQIVYSILLASDRSKFILLGSLIQGLSKIAIVVLLLGGEHDVNALVSSFVFSYLMSIVIMGLPLLKELRNVVSRRVFTNSKGLIQAGFSNWLPALVSAVGGQLSVLSVFGFAGADQAGGYYMASAVFSAIVGLPIAMFSAALPIMSGMVGSNKLLSWQITRYSLMLSLPLSAITWVYAEEILVMLNANFYDTALPLQVLMLGVAPAIINYSIYYLLYANGRFKIVLLSGLMENVSRVVLYFLLVPSMGALGASISYISGSFLALFSLTLMARGLHTVSWKNIAVISGIPFMIAFAVTVLSTELIVGGAIILVLSLFIYLKLNVARLDEVCAMVAPLISNTFSESASNRVQRLIRMVGKPISFRDSEAA